MVPLFDDDGGIFTVNIFKDTRRICIIISKKSANLLYYVKDFVFLEQNNHCNISNNQQNMMLNRLKVVLVEQGKTNRWLSEQLGKSENTVSRWCANKVQPSITQLNEISTILKVDIRTLIRSSKEIENLNI